MPNKLKPCPFCGEDAGEVFDIGGFCIDSFYVSCRECESRGPCKETKRKAIEAWNRRKPNGV